MKIIILFSLITVAMCFSEKTMSKIRHRELFEYSPNDEYTLPKDIDDDKPAVNFQGDVRQSKILMQVNKNHGQGKFKYSLQTQNGIELTQIGKLKDDKTFVVSGSYSYTGADGRRYRVRYTADEFGYHPITELDVEIPVFKPIVPKQNDFRFLSNAFDFGKNTRPTINPFDSEDGYNYDRPIKTKFELPRHPLDRRYLPSF